MMRLGVALLLVVTVSILTAPLAEAQPVAKVPRIGVLRPGLPFDPYVKHLTEGLRDLGYIDGKNIAIEYRWAHGRPDRLPTLAMELVRLNVAVILNASVSPPTRGVHDAR